MSENRSLKNIVIVGGDEHAWSAAARLLVGLRAEGINLSVIDHGAKGLPGVLSLDSSAHAFHQKIGVQEPALVANAGACYRYGECYKTAQSQFVFTYSPVGDLINRVQFHHYVARLKNLGIDTDYFSHSIAVKAALDNRFTHPQAGSALDKLDYAVNVDRMRYIHLLRNAVLEHSVQHIEGDVVSSTVAENGDISALQLSSGESIDVDFILDCTGTLRRADYQSWANFLAYDRRLSWVQESTSETPVLTFVEALDQHPEHTSLRESALPGGRYFQLSFVGDLVSEQQAVESAKLKVGGFSPQLSEYTNETAGVLSQPWHHNVLSLSCAAGYAGNQLFSELYHTHTALERWLSLYPSATNNTAANELLAKQYNRETLAEYEHVRDAHVLLNHSIASQLRASHSVLPSTLAHRISLFEGTGRVAFYESDVLNPAQWVNLFIGCGYWPKQTDALLNSLDAATLEKLLGDHAQQTAALAKQFPKHDELLLAIRNTV